MSILNIPYYKVALLCVNMQRSQRDIVNEKLRGQNA